LALARLDGDNEGLARLAMRLAAAVWNAPEVSLMGRLQFTAWAPLVASLPMRAAVPLIQLAFAPGDRRAAFGFRTGQVRAAACPRPS
jgi:hypothetical protein